MGNPKQELFLQDRLGAMGCIVGIGVGALFDFIAGEIPRAMFRVQKWHLEWVYRLAQEPRRLLRRYLLIILCPWRKFCGSGGVARGSRTRRPTSVAATIQLFSSRMWPRARPDVCVIGGLSVGQPSRRAALPEPCAGGHR